MEGVKGASNLLYMTKNLCLKGLKDVTQSTLADGQLLCRIDVDCSWIALKQLHARKSINPFNAAKLLNADVLLLLKKAGFIATPICDTPGGYCHYSKLAFIEQIMKVSL